ncbi:MAG: bifunctional alpha,alpha-trehalose-phosphate synthase (UDP-forming)/trehalose-phosphatase [Mucilaginibacter sp.]
MPHKLFIVSNRLPITIEQNNGQYTCRQSSGGLVSAVSAYLNGESAGGFSQTIWAGVPTCTEKIWNNVIPGCEEGDYTYSPVFVKARTYESYYNGFANSLLWPLFHYFPSYADYSAGHFDDYMAVNKLFADTLLKEMEKDDTVWIHDYHLLPLAEMLRQAMPSLTIGLFLHTPFPSYEMFRIVPKKWQNALLTGMLGADLIGFHTIDYASHFLFCAETVLKAEHEGSMISWKDRQVKVDVFPISIDFDRFYEAYDELDVVERREEYQEIKGDKKLIFSVDRLDYTKGVLNRLKGYKRFLTQSPNFKGLIVFVLVVVPSRDGIKKYAERKRIIDEYIGDINSSLGNISWQPVIYQYGHLNFSELVALYTSCDLALITPLRDGMNLVAKEFVASRKDQKGVLILSEMAGAARELSAALLINPNDTDEIADAIKKGLEMPEQEQKVRLNAMQQRIRKYNVDAWANDFFGQMKHVKEIQLDFEIKFLDEGLKARLLSAYNAANRRLILLDYDGTLVAFNENPMLAAPEAELIQLLTKIAENRQNDIYIVSGRDGNTLDEWLGTLPIGMIAEHGSVTKQIGGSWLSENAGDILDWKPKIESVMNAYTERCPGTFVEHKRFSLAWHYRTAGALDGSLRAKELYEELLKITALLDLDVLNGNKVIEVRNKGINKGVAVSQLLKKNEYDFILCIGDDKTDEDMFKKLARTPGAFTIKVGNEASFAKYNLLNPDAVKSLLQSLDGENAAKPQPKKSM